MLTLGFSGALAGSAISFGSAPFELVKVWLSITEFPTVLMTSALLCCGGSRSDASSSTQLLPQRGAISLGLRELSKPFGIL